MSVFDVQRYRADFPNLKVNVHGKPLVYLDNAATTLKPQCVIDTITEHYSREVSNIHRGVHYLSEQATQRYEQARSKVRDFLGASDLSEIIFTRGSTESINLVAQSYGRKFLQEGDEILISAMEHHSNIVPWDLLCKEKRCVLKIIPMNEQGEITQEEYVKLLSSRTKIVSLVWVSNSLGTVNPIKEMIHLAHQRKAIVLIDAAQAVTYTQIDVKDLDCDFLVFSGHKLFGPTGIGVLYGKHRLLENMPPYQGGGDMIASVSFVREITYNVLPYKFEAGTPAIAEVIGLGAAIDYIKTLNWVDMKAYKQELLAYGIKKLLSIDGVRLIGTAKEKTSILSFVVEGIHPHDLGTLVDQEGVAVRTGHHCTQPVMEFFKIPATARASLAFYNTKEELDVLAQALIKAKKTFGI